MQVKLLHFSDLGSGKLLEMESFSFHFKDFSRALLQELSRHRSGSPTVKSTRYTLKELKHLPPFTLETCSEFIHLTNNQIVDKASLDALNNLQSLIKQGISNDIAKYAMPESFKTEETFTIGYEGLKNLLELRTHKSALKEFRILAYHIWNLLPPYIQDTIDVSKNIEDIKKHIINSEII